MSSALPEVATVEGLARVASMLNTERNNLIDIALEVRDKTGDIPLYSRVWGAMTGVSEAKNVLAKHGVLPVGVKPLSISLADLAAMDTPASRRLLALLREALPLAEEVDKERGNYLPDHTPGPDGSRGCDYAESVSHLVCRLAMETEPPKGRD